MTGFYWFITNDTTKSDIKCNFRDIGAGVHVYYINTNQFK